MLIIFTPRLLKLLFAYISILIRGVKVYACNKKRLKKTSTLIKVATGLLHRHWSNSEGQTTHSIDHRQSARLTALVGDGKEALVLIEGRKTLVRHHEKLWRHLVAAVTWPCQGPRRGMRMLDATLPFFLIKRGALGSVSVSVVLICYSTFELSHWFCACWAIPYAWHLFFALWRTSSVIDNLQMLKYLWIKSLVNQDPRSYCWADHFWHHILPAKYYTFSFHINVCIIYPLT